MQTQTTEGKSLEGFSLKRKIFNDYSFVQALRELSKSQLEIQVAWNVNRIIRQAQKAIDEGQEHVKKILDSHVEKDEAGKYKQADGDFVFKDKEAFKKEYDAFGEEDVHFKSYKLNLASLAGVHITPESIGALEPIVDEQ
jgi:hypothetical protein